MPVGYVVKTKRRRSSEVHRRMDLQRAKPTLQLKSLTAFAACSSVRSRSKVMDARYKTEESRMPEIRLYEGGSDRERSLNRSVRQILKLYDTSVDVELEESGTRDGVSYELYSPKNDSASH